MHDTELYWNIRKREINAIRESTEAMRKFLTPWLSSSVSTLSQNLAPLVSHIHIPISSLCPFVNSLDDLTNFSDDTVKINEHQAVEIVTL